MNLCLCICECICICRLASAGGRVPSSPDTPAATRQLGPQNGSAMPPQSRGRTISPDRNAEDTCWENF